MTLLELVGVSAGYGTGEPVVRGVDLQLAEGDFLGLIGPNGCGKSTLMRAAAGVLPLRGGRAVLEGRNLQTCSRRDLAKLLGVVAQESVFAPGFSVQEIVAMGRHPHLGRFGRPGREDEYQVHRALDQTGILALAAREAVALSGGERQRVAIARALAQSPRLLLLDEPTNHLDINHQVEVFDLLHDLNHEQGLAILCVTHDLNLAAEYCSAIALLEQGLLRAWGPPSEVLTPSLLGAAYGVEVLVEEIGGTPRIFPVTRRTRSSLALGGTP
ncbi:MAG: ABC transporter ATP-binding protein [Candidatus Latescibacteria bacterium]|nr:ABC transporter ATP-binding protein [Candidatus Latescibacterota bacterium]